MLLCLLNNFDIYIYLRDGLIIFEFALDRKVSEAPRFITKNNTFVKSQNRFESSGNLICILRNNLLNKPFVFLCSM